MGCDIHCWVEERVGDEWVFIPDSQFYDDRSYSLFGALAGVRRGGIDHPEQKGFPKDASDGVKREYDDWGLDAHSASYLTLEELADHRQGLGTSIPCSGMISEREAFLLAESGIPPSMGCGYTNAEGWVYAEWREDYNPLDHFIEKLLIFLKKEYNTLGETLDKTRAAIEVRVVFWFDN